MFKARTRIPFYSCKVAGTIRTVLQVFIELPLLIPIELSTRDRVTCLRRFRRAYRRNDEFNSESELDLRILYMCVCVCELTCVRAVCMCVHANANVASICIENPVEGFRGVEPFQKCPKHEKHAHAC